MNRAGPVRGYQGAFLVGFVIIAVVTVRLVLFYRASLLAPVLLIAAFTLLYGLQPWLASRFAWHGLLYFPVQTLVVIALTALRPFTDISSLLYLPLAIQALRVFSRRAATIWLVLYTVLLGASLLLGLRWAEALALFLLDLAVSAFLISYDLLYARMQAGQAESQRLLADLQAAHRQLQEYAAQAEELAATRERNRLARELHDSVSQAIFSIRLTSQAARILLDRDPARVPEQIDRLQSMTAEALARLRAMIAELRPPRDASDQAIG